MKNPQNRIMGSFSHHMSKNSKLETTSKILRIILVVLEIAYKIKNLIF